MTVTLKQRTCMNDDGKAVPPGHPDSAFLVGPKGAKVTDAQANQLGLVDGALPDFDKIKAEVDESIRLQREKDAKEREEHNEKLAIKEGRKLGRKEADKPEDKSVKQGENKDAGKDETKGDPIPLDARIKDCMVTMATEASASSKAEEELFTTKGAPDSYVLSSRLQVTVTAPVRDRLWEEVLKADPSLADRS